MKKFLTLSLFCASLCACKNKPAAPEKKESSKDTTQAYLPIQNFIREDIKKTDSFAGGILVKTNRDGKKDSVFINPEEFHDKASAFFSNELDSANFQANFIENSFMDETSELLQFMYETKNSNNQLRKVIVYIKPSLSVDKVSRVYMEKEFASGDTLVQQKLTWTIQQYFTKVTIKDFRNQTKTEIEKVIWDPQHFADE